MGEWRRIISSPGRLAFLIAIPVLSVVIFFPGLVGEHSSAGYGPDDPGKTDAFGHH